jgi:hypothetical protein
LQNRVDHSKQAARQRSPAFRVVGVVRGKKFARLAPFGGDTSSGLLLAGPNRFPQKWQTNGNNSQARAGVPN